MTLKNRHAVWALALAVALGGIAAYRAMPMQLFPDTAPPMVTVVTPQPGAAAGDIAHDLSEPLEEVFAAISGVAMVRSSSLDNLSLITVEFDYARGRELAAVDVQNAIARVRAALPQGIGEPQVLSFSSADRPVITLGASMPDPGAARKLADDQLARALQRIPGVAAVDVFGGHRSAELIEVDLHRLSSYGLSFAQVSAAVRAATSSAPAGRFRSARTQSVLQLESRGQDRDQLAELALPLGDGTRLRLSDVATIRRATLDDDARFAINATPAIALQVFKTDEANTVDVVQAVRALSAELERAHPGLTLLVGEELATFTQIAVANLLESVWQALLLASLIIFLFLGHLRASAVAIVSMPLSYGLTFAMMYLAKVPFDMVTLSAVILAVGMVVDASVVVLENITRVRDEHGLSSVDAAIHGSDEIRMPVIAGAATTLIVLVPLTLLPGFVGRTFGPLALTLVFAFTSSLIVALFLVPVLSLYTGGTGTLDRFGVLLARPWAWLMQWVAQGYRKLLDWALRARVLTLLVAVLFLGLSARALLGQGMEVLPKMDSGAFFIALETASDASIDQTEDVVRQVEMLLQAEPQVRMIQSQIGFEPGMRSSGTHGANQAYISVELSARTERDEDIWSIEGRVRQGLGRIPGLAHAVVRESGNTARPTSAAPVVLRLAGPDPLVLDQLADQARDLLDEVPSVVAPTRSWRLDQRQTYLRVDEARAHAVGLSDLEVARQLMAASEGVEVGVMRARDATTTPVRVRAARAQLAEPADLLILPLTAPRQPGGVPAREVARLGDGIGQGLVTRQDGLYTLDLSAGVQGRALSFVIADIQQLLPRLNLPAGYYAGLTGENDDLVEARQQLGGALAVSLVAVYLLLVAQLRSFLHPFTILLSVPLSLIGVAGALVLTAKPVSMPVMVGLILLVGTVVNNAIILLDFIRQQRDAGTPRRDALLAAVDTRFRPIMMTSLSTIVGMIPLAAEWGLGTERFSPLAIAVIGGMSASTLLTLLVIPVAYDLLDDLTDGLRLTKSAPENS